VGSALVDTGAELSWFPREVLESLGIKPARLTRFRQATGVVVERWTGVAIVHVADASAGDQVVFGEPGDLGLLGSRSLEGLNLVVDPVNKRLIDAGAMPAAASWARRRRRGEHEQQIPGSHRAALDDVQARVAHRSDEVASVDTAMAVKVREQASPVS
jgi:predicted aspartyl protease